MSNSRVASIASLQHRQILTKFGLANAVTHRVRRAGAADSWPALAIIDDLGAVAIIAAFYTADLSFAWLSAAAVTLATLAALNRAGVERLPVYLALGLVLWLFVLKSGGHATLAGVALAMTIPLRRSPAGRMIRPLRFMCWNTRCSLGSPLASCPFSALPMPAYRWLVSIWWRRSLPSRSESRPGCSSGKQIGVFLTTWAAVKLDWADCPEHASFAQVYGVSLLCGIGFTMSLFIGLLAFPTSPELQDGVKIGVLVGSTSSAIVGAFVLRFARGSVPMSV